MPVNQAQLNIKDQQLSISGKITHDTIPEIQKFLRKNKSISITAIDLPELEFIDSAGVAFLEELTQATFPGAAINNASEKIGQAIKTFSPKGSQLSPIPREPNFFESLGNAIFKARDALVESIYLTSEIVLWSFVGVFNSRGRRKGSVIQQCYLIGSNAVGIIALLSFVLGLILALQSAAQLRQFGASIYVADLIAISMVREMAPMMTAIIIAGRSGSAFAAEISTMKVTEELDALRMMAIDPIRYVIVPKFLAISICMPLLVILSMILGIFGGLVIGLTYLDLTLVSYLNETINILTAEDLLVGLSKSIIFAWVIVIIGSYFGFKVKGGAEGVGRVTTSAVVASIFTVIFLDALFSLIYMI
ncbi:MAG: MlaE family lipid ABC transporter permease subunit [Candidatus Marinimicrobia bacterium]|nr:MlaE family lipid ABC transporter permease subunit [Candidatus Neomarinimicrobiota bacterium]